ncbi:formate dehydrogenase accessory sulfurtransferase FdhD [Achromobacter xylosoxidans]
MLATPADLEDFALGFSLSEGIIDSAADVRGIDVAPQCDGIVVQLEISSACEARLKSRRRAIEAAPAAACAAWKPCLKCCGTVPPVAAGAPLRAQAVLAAMRDMRARQRLHDLTGATHAAGWAGADGTIALLREDVGRHNALDKLVGALARHGLAAASGMVLVSSRASFEMVQKTAAAGVPVLAAVSAPTALAVRLAQEANITLLGFLRNDDATLYAHPERILS